MACRGLVIAGTHSGVGKTSVTLSAVAALRRRGYRVQTFKVGPDYLDPTYLALASGRPCYNLDGWIMGKDYVLRLFSRVTSNADIAVIEGVMGLFDGSDPSSLEGSTAQIAVWLNLPVILVVNAHGMAQSLAAQVEGFAHFDKEVSIRAVVANHCGSRRHAAWIRESLASRSLPDLLGAIPRGAWPELPSRHLGLITADHRLMGPGFFAPFADVFERCASPDALRELACEPGQMVRSEPEKKTPAQSATLGVARDDAFHFYYQDLFDELEARGCRLQFFSPLADDGLPEGIDALMIGGGYPEEYAGELSANQAILAAIRGFVLSGRPVYAECGGLMYLSSGIESRTGERFALAGILPVWTKMLERRKALGYREAKLLEDSMWGESGAVFRGHEFHYSEPAGGPMGGWRALYSLQRRGSDQQAQEGWRRGNVSASYVHLHLASRPEALEHFLNWRQRKDET
ncbi:MAG TPA: cobyrinic acid a,c-diamide synthase [Syntrophaceae bacterium]|nr:cobyrinic acid a,c-diamide synthase [Syntrophaceae bacterium]HCX01473.1 cobyrinic acid a,c-diamide synthase [Syntrophaceae bacterium]